jgi:hypothetical protein
VRLIGSASTAIASTATATGGAVRARRRARVAALALTTLAVLTCLTACEGRTTSPAGGEQPAPKAREAVPPEPDYELASCTDFYSWRDAQDELDADPALEDALDEDHDGIACNDLAQDEYASGWQEAYPEACGDVFFESPDGVLYADGIGYEQYDCESTDPGSGDWEGDAYSEPEDDGLRDGWQAACEEFFAAYVGGDLFWGEDVVVSQTDCELASPY